MGRKGWFESHYIGYFLLLDAFATYVGNSFKDVYCLSLAALFLQWYNRHTDT